MVGSWDYPLALKFLFIFFNTRNQLIRHTVSHMATHQTPFTSWAYYVPWFLGWLETVSDLIETGTTQLALAVIYIQAASLPRPILAVGHSSARETAATETQTLGAGTRRYDERERHCQSEGEGAGTRRHHQPCGGPTDHKRLRT